MAASMNQRCSGFAGDGAVDCAVDCAVAGLPHGMLIVSLGVVASSLFLQRQERERARAQRLAAAAEG